MSKWCFLVLNVNFSNPVSLCWLTKRKGGLGQCGPNSVWQNFPSSSESQHAIVMYPALLVSCTVTTAETAATGSYRKPEGWGMGSGQHRVLTEDRTMYVFTSAQHCLKVVDLSLLTADQDFTVDRSILTCRPAAGGRQLVWKYLPISAISVHIFDRQWTRNHLQVSYTDLV